MAPHDRLIVSAVEHPAVLAEGPRFARGRLEASRSPADGVVDLVASQLSRDARRGDGGASAGSLMAANNETGVIQPIAEAAAIVHRHGGLMHSDAVQAPARCRSISKRSAPMCSTPVGAQDRRAEGRSAPSSSRDERAGPRRQADARRRAGSGPSAPAPRTCRGIVGFGSAPRKSRATCLPPRSAAWRGCATGWRQGLRRFRRRRRSSGARAPRLPNTSALGDARPEGPRPSLIKLDLAGAAVSSGSACSSGKVKRSHVLDAMGVDPAMSAGPCGALRLGLDHENCEADIDRFPGAPTAKLVGANSPIRGAPGLPPEALSTHQEEDRTDPRALNPLTGGVRHGSGSGDHRSGQVDRRRPVQIRLRHRASRSDKARHRASPRTTVRFISARKNEPEWMLEWRLDAFRRWLTMREPNWARVNYPPIDYQDLYYYAAPKKGAWPKSLDEVDPAILETYEKLGIPLREQRNPGRRRRPRAPRRGRCGVRFGLGRHAPSSKELAQAGVIFCSISEAVQRASRAGAEVSRHRRAGRPTTTSPR